MKSPSVIVITGASSGIGAALARHYAQSGVFLGLIGRDEARLKALARDCEGFGAQVQILRLDVTDRAAMDAALTALDAARPIDLLIANAGISAGTGGVLQGEPQEQVRRVFDVNMGGVLNTIEPIIPRMIARGSGQIALMSSLAGFRPFPGAPAYGASKGAVRLYGEALRGSIRGSGVRVNVICPGFIKTPMTAVNAFPMPFLMPAERCAAIIARGLARDRGRIAFPFVMRVAVWVLAALPDALVQKMLKAAPSKRCGKAV